MASSTDHDRKALTGWNADMMQLRMVVRNWVVSGLAEAAHLGWVADCLLLLLGLPTADVRPVSQPIGFDTDELGGSSPTSPIVHRLSSFGEVGARGRPADTVLPQQGSRRDDQAAYRSGRSRC